MKGINLKAHESILLFHFYRWLVIKYLIYYHRIVASLRLEKTLKRSLSSTVEQLFYFTSQETERHEEYGYGDND